MGRTCLSVCAGLLAVAGSAAAQALAEPSGQLVYFGAWVDTSVDGGSDSPQIFNNRVGQNYSVFQLTQDMPRPLYDAVTGAGGEPPEYQIEQSQTDAAVFLTVYPTSLTLADEDWETLGMQLKNYTETNQRTTFLRFAPEMQGLWNPAYGYQPVAYKALWAEMYPKIKQYAPETIIVWAPNLGQGYPYSQLAPTNQTEFNALDTNGDGVIDNDDDPFGPYYPDDDDTVDWIGLSVYWKGPNYSNQNVPNGPGYCYDVLNNVDYVTNTASQYNFYQTYCAGKPNKACMFSESGSAYHVNVAGGSTNLAMQQAWWESCITNDALYDAFPRLKMNMHFEYLKEEDGDLRDYRLSNETAIAQGFSAALDSFATRVAWADYRSLSADIPASGVPSTAVPTETTSVCTKYCGQVHFTTERSPETSAPSLFGDTRASAAARLQAGAAVGVTSIAMLSAAFWLTGRQGRNMQRAAAL